MTPVVVVESDETLRGTLQDILTHEGHYAVMEVATEATALAYLAACPEGVVAVCSNAHADHYRSTAFFAAVGADKRLARPHQYLLLSTDPARIPTALHRDLKRLHAPILPKPFEVDVLLAIVGHAASRVAATRSQRLAYASRSNGESVRRWLLDRPA